MMASRYVSRWMDCQQPVVKVRLHSGPPARLPRWGPRSTGDASPLAALLLPQILPDILGRRALPSGRLAGLGATPGLSPRAARPHESAGATDCELCGRLCSNINGTAGWSVPDEQQRSIVGKRSEAIITA